MMFGIVNSVNGGNVGIGTTSPVAKLDVAGGMAISDGSGLESIVVVDPPSTAGTAAARAQENRENIQAAIDAVSCGGKVILQAGEYTVDLATAANYAILLKAGVSLCGVSMTGTKITATEGMSEGIIRFNTSAAGTIRGSIRDLLIDGDNKTTTIGINIFNGQDQYYSPRPVIVQNVTVNDCTTAGIRVASYFTELNNCHIQSCAVGIWLSNDSTGGEQQTNAATILHCLIWCGSDSGIKIRGIGNQVIGCNVSGMANGQYGIEIEDGATNASNFISGNYIESGTAGARGVYVGSKSNIIIGNHFDLDSAGNEIDWNGTAANVTGNTVLCNHNQRLSVGSRNLDASIETDLGIGTTSPATKLEVVSKGTDTDVVRVTASDGSALAEISEDASGNGHIDVKDASGTTQARVTGSGSSYFANGDTGIGTNDPKFKCHISGGRLCYGVPNSTPTDADIGTSQVTAYLDESNNKLKFRVRYSGGTLKSGEVSLT